MLARVLGFASCLQPEPVSVVSLNGVATLGSRPYHHDVPPTYTTRMSEQRIAELEASAARFGHTLAPRGTCPPCDAFRCLMWSDESRKGVQSCAACKALRQQHRKLEDLIEGWAVHQQTIAAAGGWTPELLRAHSKALHLEGR